MGKHYKPKEFAKLLNVSVIISRDSTSNQKYDLKNQVEFLKQYM